MYDERGHRLFIPSIYTFKYLVAPAAPSRSEVVEAPEVAGSKVLRLTVSSFVKCS